MLCHALEKGMGISNTRFGYGKEKALHLIRLVSRIKPKNSEESYVFQESCAVLEAYFRFQNDNGCDVSYLENEFRQINVPENIRFDGGYKILSGEELLLGTQCDFEKLVYTRHSARLCSKDEITEQEMKQAIRLAVQCPSACNRQPCKVYYTPDRAKNEKLSKLVPGNKGFEKDIPYYCVVTSNKAYFSGNEFYQWYINGGIFLNQFVLALHSIGIGSCIFQYPLYYETEAELKKLIGKTDSSEVVIAILGYGKYADSAKYICAARKPIEDVGILF